MIYRGCISWSSIYPAALKAIGSRYALFLKLIIAEYGKREKRSEARKEEAEEIKEIGNLLVVKGRILMY